MPPRNQFTNNRIAIDHMTMFQFRQAGRIIYFAEIKCEAILIFFQILTRLQVPTTIKYICKGII